LIRHAYRSAAFAVIPLPIAMIELPLGTLLVLAVGLTTLLAAGFLAAAITAIAVATITTAADVELGSTATRHTKSLAKPSFRLAPHPHPFAGWTSATPS